MHSFRSQPFELGDTTIELLERNREADLGRIRDTQCSIAASELMAARIPDASLAIFEDSNHFPYEEEPDAFREAIRRFATRLWA
jgi:hypothetical protein